VAGGKSSKRRKWLGNKLDATKRSQVMFMDRNDILICLWYQFAAAERSNSGAGS